MAIISVSLPDQMQEYVDSRISEGKYNTTSEYLRELIRADQKRHAEDNLETLLLRGLDSPATEWKKEDVQHLKDSIRERLATT